jgi:hypothetical protein
MKVGSPSSSSDGDGVHAQLRAFARRQRPAEQSMRESAAMEKDNVVKTTMSSA